MSSDQSLQVRLLPLEERYRNLSQHLDIVERGEISEASFRRHVRLSSRAHQTLTETISHSLEAITKDLSASSESVTTIARCNKMLMFSEDYVSRNTFPFTELPREVRDMIYKLVLGMIDSSLEEVKPRLRRHKQYRCNDKECCRLPYYTSRTGASPVNIAILATNQLIRSESAPIFYRCHTFDFYCTSDLLTYITTNCYFRDNVSSVTAVWSGSKSDMAFAALGKMAITNLQIRITTKTACQKTQKEMTRLVFFPDSKTRLTDVVGAEELLNLNGLTSVSVYALNSKRFRETNHTEKREIKDEVKGFEAMLRSKLLLPRPA